MLWLLFNMAQDRYALDVRHVVEIIPLAQLKELPRSPDYVSGLLNFRGNPLSVIDLSRLNTGKSCGGYMSTRIIVVELRQSGGSNRMVGLMAERVVETLKCERADFVSPGINAPNADYLGDVYSDASGMIQLIEIDKLVPDKVMALLFPAEQAA